MTLICNIFSWHLHILRTEPQTTSSRSVRTISADKALSGPLQQPARAFVVRWENKDKHVPALHRCTATSMIFGKAANQWNCSFRNRRWRSSPWKIATVYFWDCCNLAVLLCSVSLAVHVFYLESASFFSLKHSKLHMIKHLSWSSHWVLSAGIINTGFCFFFPYYVTWI